MKILVNVCRIIVGLLFIFSGLIKANDPLGLAYKMEEFFEIWNASLAGGSFFLKDALISLFDFLHHHSLFLAVVMIAFEIIAGAALLLGWQMKLFVWLLLLLTLFFTFLTGYAYLSGKFKNCGCFGDCIPITPLTSFLKDVVLTVLIVFLFLRRKWIQPLFNKKVTLGLMAIVILLSFGMQWYTLNYLPVFDCLPYKKGKNITEQMKMPANAIPDSTVITFVYEKQGRQVEFTADKFPADFDSTYIFKSRYDKVIRPGKNNEPPIKGFVLNGVSGVDSAAVVLSQPYAVLLYFIDFSTSASKWREDFADLYKKAGEKNVPVYVVTARMSEAVNVFNDPAFAGIQVFSCDNTAIKTAARTNPSVYLLKQGTIMDKWSYREAKKAIRRLTSLVVQQPVQQQQQPLQPDSVPAPVDNTKIK
jgi:uncharacterized membrane protein YphA (DoxX/SURF4 family)